MKMTKLILLALLTFFTAEGFAQFNCGFATRVTYGSNYDSSNNSFAGYSSKIRFYARELRLSRRQARELHYILRDYSRDVHRVRSDRFLGRRSKRAKIRRLLENREWEVRDLLSRRQYDKYRYIRDFEQYRRSNWRCGAHGAGCSNSGCYDSYFENRYDDGWNNFWNRDRRRDWDRRYGNDRDWNDRGDWDDWDDRDDRNWDRRGDRDDRGDWDDRRDDDRRRADRDRNRRGKVAKKESAENPADVKDLDTKDDEIVGNDQSDDQVVDDEKDLEEELDDYFKDEFDYGDDEEIDDYFADEN